MSERVLCVIAHPDDESLFAGAALARYAANGVPVHVVSLADGVGARLSSSESDVLRRRKQFLAACAILGAEARPAYVFRDQRSDQVSQLHINRCVEGFLQALPSAPTIVVTHHVGDLNLDHRRVAEAALVATRGVDARIYSMAPEYPARCIGPEWRPTLRHPTREFMATKLRACACYEDELRPYPHPRSLQAIEARTEEEFMVIA